MPTARFQPLCLLIVLLCAAAQLVGYGRGLELCLGCDEGGGPMTIVQGADCCACAESAGRDVPDQPSEPESPCGCLDLTMLEAGTPSPRNPDVPAPSLVWYSAAASDPLPHSVSLRVACVRPGASSAARCSPVDLGTVLRL